MLIRVFLYTCKLPVASGEGVSFTETLLILFNY
jgi:hypothetical protein